MIQVSKGHFTGGIYLQDGRVIHAELYDKSGLDAVFELFLWGEAINIWRQGKIPERFTTNFPMDYVLECYEKEKMQRAASRPQPPDDALLKDLEQNAREAKNPKTASMDQDKLMVVLESLSPDWAIKEYPLADPAKKSFIIGSGAHCDIQLNHESVAEQHCAILIDEVLRVWDLGTGGATLLNDQVVDDVVLEQGDRLQIGSLPFAVHLRLRRSAFVNIARPAVIPDIKSKITPSTAAGFKNNLALTSPLSFNKIQDKERKQKALARKSVLSNLFNKKSADKTERKKGK